MKDIPNRQDALNDFARKYLSPEPNGHTRHTNGHSEATDMDDEEIIARCREAKNAPKFASLFDDGDAAAYDGDDSRADMALVSLLAFWTDDPAQLDRLFRRSALYRAKWDERRGARTYGQRTIDHALENRRESYGRNGARLIAGGGKSEPQDEVRSRSQYLGNEVISYEPEPAGIRAVSFRGREKPSPREWIVDRAVCKGHPASWYGESGIAKSLLAAHMGLHIAADGVDYWAGLRVQTVPVIYGDFELDEHEHLRRAQELTAGMGLPDVPTKFHYLPLAGLPAAEAFSIAAEECKRLEAGLFIVDSVGFALDGDSELAKDVLRFYRECIQPIRAAGATPFLIDHQAKVIKGEKYSDKQEFGSVYKTNATRSSFQIRGAWDGNEMTATFTHRKTNFGPKVEDFSLRLAFEKDRVSVERLAEAVPNPDREPSKKEQVYAALEELGRATSETVANKTGIPTQTVRNAISELAREGAIVDTEEKQGRFRIFVTHSHTTKGPGPGASTEQSVQRLVDAGMKPDLARNAVLRKREA